MQGDKNKLNNQMWLARKRLGLQQKQVAHLLGHRTTDQVSRYEQGLRLPGLKLFLQLEIIYGVSARVLYRDLYEELQKEIKARAQSVKVLNNAYTVSANDAQLSSEFCSYEELLSNPTPSQAERDRVQKHILTLMNRRHGL